VIECKGSDEENCADPNRCDDSGGCEWRFEDAYGVRGSERWEMERLKNSSGARTMIRFTNDCEIPGRFDRVIDWLLTRHALARRNRDYLNELARLAERRPRGSEA
jgi:hypothetical protein